MCVNNGLNFASPSPSEHSVSWLFPIFDSQLLECGLVKVLSVQCYAAEVKSSCVWFIPMLVLVLKRVEGAGEFNLLYQLGGEFRPKEAVKAEQELAGCGVCWSYLL